MARGDARAKVSAEERAAMQEWIREKSGAGEGEAAVLAKIADLDEPDRGMAERLHELIRRTAPDLQPRTWYGMPAYARGGQVLVFFQPAAKFKSRYATLGFSDKARLDDGTMWPTSYAITAWTAETEARIAELLKKAQA